jgi:serine/threonine protein phosphatase PrpC
MSNFEWRITGAAVTGTSHLANKAGCQDRLGWRVFEASEGPVLAAVVSDGAGSTSEGEKGAEIACDSFLNEVASILGMKQAGVSSFREEFGIIWISHFQGLITELAEKKEKEAREYSSTFVGAVIGSNDSVFYQVGDGGVLFTSPADPETFRFGIVPEETEYVNMTSFLTDEDAQSQLMYTHIDEGISDLVLFSDGITNVAVDFATGEPFEPFLRPMIAPLRNGRATDGLDKKLESFLGSPAINEKTDDDKTIILASRRKT